MQPVKRWWRWFATTTGATMALCLLPVAAWAHSGPGAALVGDELARRPRRSPTGLLGACCCLVVVLVIVLIVMLFRRRRQPPPPPPPPAPPQ